MFFKSILTSAVLASTLALGTAGAAKADSTLSIGFGIDSGAVDIGYADGPWPHHHGYGFAGDGWDGGWHARHRFDYRISCGEGASIARSRGFHGVRPVDCSAPVYEYQGWKYGQPFNIQVSMRGRLLGASPSAW